MLLRAEQVARAAYLQVAHGQLEAGAELGVFPDRVEPAPSVLAERLALAVGEVCVCMLVAAPHAPADLVQLGKPQPVRVLDDEGVGVGDVHARLNDGGADQHVDFPLDHAVPDGGELLFAHLPVGHLHRRLRQGALDAVRRAVYRLDPVVQVVALPAPAELTAQRVHENALVVLQHIGGDGVPVQRRLFEHGHVPYAGQRHVQGAGYGRGGQRQHVYGLGQLFQVLLVRYAEALFLVHNQQAQVLELDVLLNDPVRADQDVDFPAPQLAQNNLLLRGRTEAREQFGADGIALEPAPDRIVVLPGQQRGGHEHGDLLAVENAFESRAQGDFRLAEAHVAAEQAVHGRLFFHIGLDFLGAYALVLGLLIFKRCFKFALPVAVRRKGEALDFLALGVQGDQLFGQVFYIGARAALGAGPLAGSELVELDLYVGRSADVFGNLVELSAGDKQGVRARVADLDKVLGNALALHLVHALVYADAVVLVHNIVARLDVGKTGNPFAAFIPALFPAGESQPAAAEQGEFRVGVLKAAGEAGAQDTDAARLDLVGLGPRMARGDSALLQQARQPVAPRGRARKHGAGIAAAVVVADLLRQRRVGAGRGQAFDVEPVHVLEPDLVFLAQEILHQYEAPPFEQQEQLCGFVEVRALADGQAALGEGGYVLLQLKGEPLKALLYLDEVEAEHEGAGIVVENAPGLGIDKGQIPVYGRKTHVLQVLQVAFAGGGRLLFAAQPLQFAHVLFDVRGDHLARLLSGEHFEHGENGDAVGLLDSPLCLRIVKGQAVDLVSEQLQAHGIGVVGRKELNNPAAVRKLARALGDLGERIPGPHEKGRQLAERTAPARRELHGVLPYEIGRREKLHKRVRRDERNLVTARAQPAQRGDALELLGAGYAFKVVKYIFPGGEQQNVLRRVEHGEQVVKALRLPHVGHDENAAFAKRIA